MKRADDAVIAEYNKSIGRTLLRDNVRLKAKNLDATAELEAIRESRD